MIPNIAVNDELWQFEPLTTNCPSRLFHLEPIGVNTFYIESLTSYVARLAEAHSVTPGTLLASEVRPIVRQRNSYTPDLSIVALYGQASVKALNGTQVGAKQLVKALEALTKRTDLQFLTMLPWAEVFPVLGLLKHFHAWCPYCYQEWLNNKQVIYSPLLWALKAVKICPIHHQLLDSKCPHCDQEFLPLWSNSLPGFCLKCGGWLGINPSIDYKQKCLSKEVGDLKQEIWIAQTLGELIGKAPDFPSPPSREVIKTMLWAYVNQYTQGNVSAFGRWLGAPSHQIFHWCSGVTIPNLDKLLSICYILETTLVDFLSLQLVPLSPNKLASLSAHGEKKILRPVSVIYKNSLERNIIIEAMELALLEEPPPSLTQLAIRLGLKTYSSLTVCSKSLSAALADRYAQYQQQFRQEQVQNILCRSLESDEYPPPSLRKIALSTGIGLGTFYHYCPTLCHAISLRYKDYQKFRYQQLIEQGCREVRQIAPVIYAKGINPTAKNLIKFMQNPSSLWHAEVLEVLKQVRRELEQ